VTSDPSQDRQRLGELLIRRRLDLDGRYRNRQVFADERGVEYRIVSDIERARRANFHAVTIAEIERAYELPPGAIGRFLDGGELEMLPARPMTAGQSPPARRRLPVLDDGDEEGLQAYLQGVRDDLARATARYGIGFTGAQAFTDPLEARWWDGLPSMTPAERERLIALTRRMTAEAGRSPSRNAMLCH
jgi:hypothetical protein